MRVISPIHTHFILAYYLLKGNPHRNFLTGLKHLQDHLTMSTTWGIVDEH